MKASDLLRRYLPATALLARHADAGRTVTISSRDEVMARFLPSGERYYRDVMRWKLPACEDGRHDTDLLVGIHGRHFFIGTGSTGWDSRVLPPAPAAWPPPARAALAASIEMTGKIGRDEDATSRVDALLQDVASHVDVKMGEDRRFLHPAAAMVHDLLDIERHPVARVYDDAVNPDLVAATAPSLGEKATLRVAGRRLAAALVAVGGTASLFALDHRPTAPLPMFLLVSPSGMVAATTQEPRK